MSAKDIKTCRTCANKTYRIVGEWMDRTKKYYVCPFAFPKIGLIEQNDEACGEYTEQKENTL